MREQGNDGDATEGKRTGAKEGTAREKWTKTRCHDENDGSATATTTTVTANATDANDDDSKK